MGHDERLFVSGGGGPSAAGVPNRLVECRMDKDRVRIRVEAVYDTGESPIMSMAYHPSEDRLACGVDDVCHVYAVTRDGLEWEKKVVTSLEDGEYQKCVRFKPDGRDMVTSGTDGMVKIWPLQDNGVKRTINAHKCAETDWDKETIDLDVTNKVVLTVTKNACKVYKYDEGYMLESLPREAECYFRGAKFSPEISEVVDSMPRYVYTCEYKPLTKMWIKRYETNKWTCEKGLAVQFAKDHPTSFCLSRNGKLLAVGTAEGFIRVYDASSMQEMARVSVHRFYIPDMVILEAGSGISSGSFRTSATCKIASVSGDGTLKLTTVKMRGVRTWTLAFWIAVFVTWILWFFGAEFRDFYK
ncbi:uncharacterized protein LOC126323715 [Schistocerca gregaria]|uniref:uncharacterized protein LOC126323715 n=1 Tax=Schistocerca gregaria TaxID=7010 RepID=UPI00211E3207|nr:uncharacterized protein LOC126323715 [Schistocerca gregaria]